MSTDKTHHYLSSDQLAAVQAAVRTTESQTSGEIVPMLVSESNDYREAASQAASLISVTIALAISIAIQDTSIWFFLPMAFILYFPVSAGVRRWPLLKLAFTPAVVVNEAVRLRAIRAFYERGLHRTREENGILIFISLLERKVWILGDRGINAVIPSERWNSLASALSRGIRDGRMAESMVTTITEAGTILREHFPHRTDDTNELPDLLEE
ncbi:MAG: TPM domain-containing protein [Desulfuromonadaceae bacterium]|nr:TPM domain-containing protein [Desulfuromonadaceae bacterium]